MTHHETGDVDFEQKRRDFQVRAERAEAAKLEAEVEKLRGEVASETQNRELRYPVAIGALTVMVVQVALSNAIFGWYGDTNAWDVSATAISAWMGTTVVEVIGVVLVVMNYLFPRTPNRVA
jgi:hypothetical protein